MKAAHVLGLGLWSTGFPSIETWSRGNPDPKVESPACSVIPSRQKRATSLTTRMGAEVIGQATMAAGVELSEVKMVFGSTYGEFHTAIAQMEMMETEDGRLSPSRFKNSVHNTVTGLLSIATTNRGFGTALAAGPQTFAMCLLESLALLDSEGGTVVLAVADEWPGAPFVTGQPFAPLALGFCLTAESSAKSILGTLSNFTCCPVREKSSATIPKSVYGNPAAAALPLFDAIFTRRSGSVPLVLEAHESWYVHLAMPADEEP